MRESVAAVPAAVHLSDAASEYMSLLLSMWDDCTAPSMNQDACTPFAPKPHLDGKFCDCRFAYVSVLFGRKPGYCIDALVLGEALRVHGTDHKYILLHTADVPDEWRAVLQKVGWEMREVEYLNGENLYNGSQRGRFAGVFTKLHALKV